jgi:hypothetical protein
MSEPLKSDEDGRHYNHADREACLDPTALVKRAIEGVRKYKPKGPGRRQTPMPLWVRVKDIFHHGSGYSSEVCRRFGFDPNETWVGEDDA